MKITFDELEKMKCASVTDYCRVLMKKDPDKYKDETIEVYRGEMLCLTVTNVCEAAEVEPTGSGWQKYTGRRQSNGCTEV